MISNDGLIVVESRRMTFRGYGSFLIFILNSADIHHQEDPLPFCEEDIDRGVCTCGTGSTRIPDRGEQFLLRKISDYLFLVVRKLRLVQ
ncbi:hypothetical protein NPIL_659051 [Nephila pilipes]|uniref:Uncharacterized protein n=1 Tax=Nephila pilipes TaxID=299642 RepID=A0A8X6NXP1_NEPPI|nr:hypothetical protein NPIL_659051 [Nephila pilipes]